MTVIETTSTLTDKEKAAKKLASAAAIKATNDALAAISQATRPTSGVKIKEYRAKVDANKATKLTEKLTLLGTGKFEHKGKSYTLNVRRTLVEMVKAANVGATVEQLRTAGIPGRFQWAGIEVPVRAYCEAKGDAGKLVVEVLFPAVEAKVEKPEVKAPAAKKPPVKKAG